MGLRIYLRSPGVCLGRQLSTGHKVTADAPVSRFSNVRLNSCKSNSPNFKYVYPVPQVIYREEHQPQHVGTAKTLHNRHKKGKRKSEESMEDKPEANNRTDALPKLPEDACALHRHFHQLGKSTNCAQDFITVGEGRPVDSGLLE